MTDREYTTSVTDNDYLFTGKERDSEKSGYDYFGARYLNSRIGRWGGVDVSMDKFPQISPYNYAFNNSLKTIDPDGRDAKVIIDYENGTIEITITAVYISSSIHKNIGLNDEQVEVLKSFKEDVESYWSGTWEIDGKEFEVTTNFQIIEAKSNSEAQELMVEGSTLARNDDGSFGSASTVDGKYEGVGVVGNNLLLKRGYNPDATSGAHEVGHLVGLPDTKYGKGIMSPFKEGERRFKPNDNDLNEIFDYARNSDINFHSTEAQYLRSFIKEKTK